MAAYSFSLEDAARDWQDIQAALIRAGNGQATILNHQGSRNTIIKNQKQILALLKK
jgi:hypothetical protein